MEIKFLKFGASFSAELLQQESIAIFFPSFSECKIKPESSNQIVISLLLNHNSSCHSVIDTNSSYKWCNANYEVSSLIKSF